LGGCDEEIRNICFCGDAVFSDKRNGGGSAKLHWLDEAAEWHILENLR